MPIMKTEVIVQYLKNKFPGCNERDINFFLTTPNCYIDGRLPRRLKDIKRIESLFNAFLHPADAF